MLQDILLDGVYINWCKVVLHHSVEAPRRFSNFAEFLLQMLIIDQNVSTTFIVNLNVNALPIQNILRIFEHLYTILNIVIYMVISKRVAFFAS